MGVGLMKITIDIDSLEISELSDKISLTTSSNLSKYILSIFIPSTPTSLTVIDFNRSGLVLS